MISNITPSIEAKTTQALYKIPDHPICIVKEMVFDYFADLARIEIASPFVSIENNFDRLRVPKDHPSRRTSDTYYKDDETCLRTHMTCYLYPLGQSKSGESQLRYITCGDVYRKDAIDATHYPVFHQMDAFFIVDDDVDVKKHLRTKLKGLVKRLFGDLVEYRFLEEKDCPDVYFPFTIDSLEVEVLLGDKRLEILGGGTVHPDIMADLGLPNKQAWAFGCGIERLAMVMFDIPDIRLFWSQDKRFTDQFHKGQIDKFKPFSKFESCYKDVSFYIGGYNALFNYNDLCSIARDEDKEDLIESIVLLDSFDHKGRQSHCYRLTFRSMDKTLRNTDVNRIQDGIKRRLVSELGVEIR